MLPGVYLGKKKNGDVYYRSSFTYNNKHISLGSYDTEESAFKAYLDAMKLTKTKELTINNDFSQFTLPFSKIVSIINFRDNGLYMKTPIYVRQNYFVYFLSPTLDLKFDLDDLFYYSTRTISVRKGHYFVADYGMQVTITSRYGIKNHAVKGRDYVFANGDETDFRYANIIVINQYYGVSKCIHRKRDAYHVKIHLKGNYSIGYYEEEIKAAIAYNKAVDAARDAGIKKIFPINFIDEITNRQYAQIYSQIQLPTKYVHALQEYTKK
ncbi:hypothetical protein SAMN02910358_00236 [Lachnospiraceae bacterium XBB1006]|nr:hypothetical protein SAMN02910358_00236 [Lachnospiraceae bacterium XBB1006]